MNCLRLLLLVLVLSSCTRFSISSSGSGSVPGKVDGGTLVFGTLELPASDGLLYPGKTVQFARKGGVGYADSIENRWQFAGGLNAFLFVNIPGGEYRFRELVFVKAPSLPVHGRSTPSVVSRFKLDAASIMAKTLIVVPDSLEYAGALRIVLSLDSKAAMAIRKRHKVDAYTLLKAVVMIGEYNVDGSNKRTACYFVRTDHPVLIGERRARSRERIALQAVLPAVHNTHWQRKIKNRIDFLKPYAE